MKEITRIVQKGYGLKVIYSNNELMATVNNVQNKEAKKKGKYRICIYGGAAHGKITYAQNFADLNEKSVEIAYLRKELNND